jgi:hypothetical protein
MKNNKVNWENSDPLLSLFPSVQSRITSHRKRREMIAEQIPCRARVVPVQHLPNRIQALDQ